MRERPRSLIFVFLLSSFFPQSGGDQEIVIGSKKFTESVILGEILTQVSQFEGFSAIHKQQLGGTQILWNALLAGEIDMYPDYTGTLMRETLSELRLKNESELRQVLLSKGIGMTEPIGFNNTYAMGIKKATWQRLNINKISDLQNYPELKFGFSNEFMNRSDGWPGLKKYYQLPQQKVRGLDHDLAYRGLESGDIQLTDLYSTDAEIEYYDLKILTDDRGYFPAYHAVILYRIDLRNRAPGLLKIIKKIEGQILASAMIALNAQVKIEQNTEKSTAGRFLSSTLNMNVALVEQSMVSALIKHTQEHLILSGISLSGAIVISIPLGILAVRRKRLGQFILGITGIIQTIPSLALLVFMIPFLGIGAAPAIAALFLYSLLPIVRNTYTGLHDIPLEILESADALGLPRNTRLRLIELPLASRSILAGIKTSAVINIGTATLGALIGAGGFGQPILTGIRLDNISLILQGAVPAAVLAVLVQGIFESLDKVIVPKGLQIKSENS